jgi:hypothetical protein
MALTVAQLSVLCRLPRLQVIGEVPLLVSLSPFTRRCFTSEDGSSAGRMVTEWRRFAMQQETQRPQGGDCEQQHGRDNSDDLDEGEREQSGDLLEQELLSGHFRLQPERVLGGRQTGREALCSRLAA